jgi:hypothetical protein
MVKRSDRKPGSGETKPGMREETQRRARVAAAQSGSGLAVAAGCEVGGRDLPRSLAVDLLQLEGAVSACGPGVPLAELNPDAPNLGALVAERLQGDELVVLKASTTPRPCLVGGCWLGRQVRPHRRQGSARLARPARSPCCRARPIGRRSYPATTRDASRLGNQA